MTQKRRVGIVGYGVVGQRRRQFIDARDDLECVVVCDQKMPGSGEFKDGVRYHRTYPELLAEDLDILFVCVPNDIAPQATIDGLERGLHVFCEKPPGRTVEDIVRVREVEERHPKQKLKYGFNHRYHDSVRVALEQIAGGDLGDVINVRGVYGKSAIVSFESDWRTKREIAGGGILLDQGIHMVDLMRLFAGEFTDIKSYVSNGFWGHDVEDNAYALMRTDSGVVAMLHSSATQWRHRFQLEISLTRGALILSGILSGSKSYGQETLTVVRRGESDRGVPPELTTSFIEDNSWKDEIDEFAETVANDGDVRSGSSYDALKSMQTVYRIYCADADWKDRFEIGGDGSEHAS